MKENNVWYSVAYTFCCKSKLVNNLLSEMGCRFEFCSFSD